MIDLWSAIAGSTEDGRVQLSMLMGALLEGGSLSGPWPAGDAGTSFGPYQIHDPVSFDPADVQAATAYMLPRYQAAVEQVDPALWQIDPASAAAQAAYLAERPAYMYPAERIAAVWQQLQPSSGDITMADFPIPGVPSGDIKHIHIPFDGDIPIIIPFSSHTGKGLGGPVISGSSLSGAWDAVTKIIGDLTDPHVWARIGLTLAAGVLLLVGFLTYVRREPPLPSAGIVEKAAMA